MDEIPDFQPMNYDEAVEAIASLSSLGLDGVNRILGKGILEAIKYQWLYDLWEVTKEERNSVAHLLFEVEADRDRLREINSRLVAAHVDLQLEHRRNEAPDFIRDEEGYALLPLNGIRLDEARQRLAGYHFAKEAISEDARDVLFYAEAVLQELDRRHGGYAR